MREHTQPRIGFCLLAGALAGFINGFFGAGGGMVLVPLLIWLCRLEDKAAFSSAIAVILPLCVVSIVIYALHDSLPLPEALPYLIGGAAGGVLAGLLFRKMPVRALHLILGGVILAGGIRLIVCGVLSGFGIGGGSLLMVWMTAVLSMEQRAAQGVNLLYFLPCAACALIFHIKNKQIVWRAVWPAALAGSVCAVGGALLAQNVDAELLRKLFGGFLILVGLSEIFLKGLKKE